ncbi:MAG: glycosyltransferase [Candidatus Xenobiia bacterium LiM19]
MSNPETILNSLHHSATIRISVMLTTHNRAQILNKCLSALSSQTLSPSLFEVFIGDDDSTDDTEEVVRSYLSTLQIYYSRAAKSNVCAARNRVLPHARGDYLLFINEDIIASQNLLEMHYTTHQEHEPEKISVVGKIALIDKNTYPPFMYYFSHFVADDSNFGILPFTFQDFRIAITCNVSVKRTALLRTGPFDEDFTLYGYYDTEFFYRLFKIGYRIYYNPLCQAEHDHLLTITSECRRSLHGGHNLILMCMKHNELLRLFTEFTSFHQIEKRTIQLLQVDKENILQTLYDLEKKAERILEDPESRANVAGTVETPYKLIMRFFSLRGYLYGIEQLYHQWIVESSSLTITIISSMHSPEKCRVIHDLCCSLSGRNHTVCRVSIDGRAEKSDNNGDDRLTSMALSFSDDGDAIPSADIVLAADRKSAAFVSLMPLSKGMKFFLVDADELDVDDKWKYTYLFPLLKIAQNAGVSFSIKKRFGEECHILKESFSGSDLEAHFLTALSAHEMSRRNLSVPDLRVERKEQLSCIFSDSEITVKGKNSSNLMKLLHEKERILQTIYQSDGWKALSFYYRIKGMLFPFGSPRWRFAHEVFITVRALFTKMGNYTQWIKKHEPSHNELVEQTQTKFSHSPLISIVSAVYNTPENIFKDMIESVQDQTYDNWELCLSLGEDKKGTLRPLIEKYMAKDRRIKAVFLERNKGIAGNSNEAIASATGDYLGFLDHDDMLAPFTLYEVVRVINEQRNAELIYSDEDILSENGRKRSDPHFKPDFSPDLLRSVNYICHFLVCKKSLGDMLGWIRDGYEGAQDYDLVLRLAEKAKLIVHIPRILYHWRKAKGSVAENTDNKLYAFEAGTKALKDHLSRLEREGDVECSAVKGYYHIRYSIKSSPLVSILIPNRDHCRDLEKCVTSILDSSTYRNIEILIVENGSREKRTFRLYENLKSTGYVTVLDWDDEFNYASINNFAAENSKGEILLFLNNDTEVITPEWIEHMLEHAQREEVGAVGAKLLHSDHTVQHAGCFIGNINGPSHLYYRFSANSSGYFQRMRIIQNVSAVTGACLMTRKELFRKVGGFDEELKILYNDIDYCMKLQEKAYLIVWTPHALLYHREMATRGASDTPEKVAQKEKEKTIFFNKWGRRILQGDPYCSSHLVMEHHSVKIRV